MLGRSMLFKVNATLQLLMMDEKTWQVVSLAHDESVPILPCYANAAEAQKSALRALSGMK